MGLCTSHLRETSTDNWSRQQRNTRMSSQRSASTAGTIRSTGDYTAQSAKQKKQQTSAVDDTDMDILHDIQNALHGTDMLEQALPTHEVCTPAKPTCLEVGNCWWETCEKQVQTISTGNKKGCQLHRLWYHNPRKRFVPSYKPWWSCHLQLLWPDLVASNQVPVHSWEPDNEGSYGCQKNRLPGWKQWHDRTIQDIVWVWCTGAVC